VTTSTDGSTDYYSSLANYFSNTSGSKSQGKAGGTSGSSQQYAAPAPQTSSTANSQGTGTGNTQGGNAQSGSNSWISAAVSDTTSNKASFVEPFSQQFGGITNNQIINSAGAIGATTTSPIAPITSGVPDSDTSGGGGFSGGIAGNPVSLVLAIFAGIALLFYVKR
jgi:hypothetical protein